MTIGINIAVPSRLDVSSAEKLLNTLSRPDLFKKEPILDFRRCDHVELGAGYRIGNALRKLSEATNLTVLVVAQDFSQSPSSEWFLNFTRSGLGPAIAAHAATVLAGERDVTEELRSYYQRALEVPSQNSVYF